MNAQKIKVLFRSSFIVFFFFCFVIFCAISFEDITNKFPLLAVIVIGVIVLLVLSYLVANFILYPLFKTNTLLDKLLKNTLHELNIPLSTIKANAQLLKTNANEKNVKRLDRILNSSEHLYRLYEEVEYYIKKEVVPIKREVFNAGDIVNECCEQIKSINKNITLEKNLDEVLIQADKIGFYKVVLNLLSNAYKYNKPNGKVNVILKDGKLHINDTGIGMSEESRFRLFDRYYQEDKDAKGYGIGLNIVKSYCDEHKIFISLTTKEKIGTQVCLSLEHLAQKTQ